MTIAWATIEDAIVAWVVAGSGIAAGKVIWADQNGERPDAPYIDVRLDIDSVGQDWLDTDDAAAPSPGAEIDMFSRGVRRLTITLRCFGGPAIGTVSPRARLDGVRSSRRLPSNVDALRVAGVGVASFSPIQSIGEALNSSKIEPRSMMTIIAFAASEVSETGTYVSDTEITDQVSVPDNVFTVEGGV